MKRITIFVFLIWLHCKTSAEIFEKPPKNETMHMEKMGRLQKKLFDNYTDDVRPVHDVNTRTNVTVSLHVQHMEVDDIHETMTVHGYLFMAWHDEFLNWDPEEYAEQTTIHVSLWRIWVPDITVVNSASGVDNWPVSYLYPAWVQSSGHVSVFPPVTFKVSCRFDFAAYPYDTQKCAIRILSRRYRYEEMDLIHPTEKVNFFMAWNNTRWHIDGWKITSSEVSRLFFRGMGTSKEPNPNGYNMLDFTFIITFQRHSPYFGVLFLLPAVVTSLLTLFAFLMNTPKLQLLVLVTCIFAQGIFLRTLVERLPPASTSVPRIVHYYSFNLVMTFLSVILVIVLTALLGWSGPIPNILEQIYNVTNWFDPKRWGGHLGGAVRSGGLGHKRFEDEKDDDESADVGNVQEMEKENEEFMESSPTGTEDDLHESAVLWRHIYDWLCRGCFVTYCIAYLLAVFSLLT